MLQRLLEQEPEQPLEFMKQYLEAAGPGTVPVADAHPAPAASTILATEEAKDGKDDDDDDDDEEQEDEKKQEHAGEGEQWEDRAEAEADGTFESDGSSRLPDLSEHHNYMAKVLQEHPRLYDRLRHVRTEKGVTLAKCIKPGVDNEGHPMVPAAGLFAGDAECFSTFRDIFHPVICRWFPDSEGRTHVIDTDSSRLPSFPLVSDFGGPKPERIIASLTRNLADYPFPNACTSQERLAVELLMVRAFAALEDQYAGCYMGLIGSHTSDVEMSPEMQTELWKLGFLPEEPDSSVAVSAGFGQRWPEARGVYLVQNHELAVSVNDLDHIKIMCSLDGSNVELAFQLVFNFVNALEKVLKSLDRGYSWAWSDSYGFLSPSISHLGTGLTVGAVVHLPRLSTRPAMMQDTMHKMGLKLARWMASSSENTMARRSTVSGTWELFHSPSIALTEVQVLSSLRQALRSVLQLESQLAHRHMDEREGDVESYLQASTATGGNEVPGAELISTDSAHGSFDAGTSGESQTAKVPLTGSQRLSQVAASIPFAELPGLGPLDMEGFPTEECPDQLPDISHHYTMLATILRRDPDSYHRMKSSQTSFGVSLARCIKPGIDTRGHAMIKTVGAVAGDAECYKVFEELFVPLANLLHGEVACQAEASPAVHRPLLHWEEACEVLDRELLAKPDSSASLQGRLEGLDLKLHRNLEKFRFTPAISAETRREVETLLSQALASLGPDTCGRYLPLATVHETATHDTSVAELKAAGLVFQPPEASLDLSAGIGRDWPLGRGVYEMTGTEGIVAWLNNEDHLTFVCRRSGSNLRAALSELLRIDEALRETLKTAHYNYALAARWGYLSSCPSNLGSALHVELRCRIPLTRQKDGFKRLCFRLGVGARDCSDDSAVTSIYNLARLGSSEADQALLVLRAGLCLSECEERFERGEDVELAQVTGRT